MNKLQEDLDLGKREDRAMLIEKSLTYLERLSPGALRTLLVQDIARLANFPAEDLEALIKSGSRNETLKRVLAPQQSTTPGILNLTTRVARILLQHPELAEQELLMRLEDLDSPGINFLKELIQLILNKPGINTAGILEHWRGNEKYWKRMSELAGDELMFNDTDKLSNELSDIVNKIRNDHLGRKKKSIIEGMTVSDLKKEEYSELIRRPASEKPGGFKDNTN